MTDLLDAGRLVRIYKAGWPHLPKGEVKQWDFGRGRVLALAMEVGGLWCHTCLTVGLRGGISEEYVVIDPRRSVDADCLIVQGAEESDCHVGQLIPLVGLRRRARDIRAANPGLSLRKAALTACTAALTETCQGMRARPSLWQDKLLCIGPPGPSIQALRGGLPILMRDNLGSMARI